MVDQIIYATKVQLDEATGFIGLPYNNLREELLKEQKWFQDSCITKYLLIMGDSPWKMKTWNTLHNLQAKQQVGNDLIQEA